MPRTTVDYELCIVGGGPAGAATALFACAAAPELTKRILLVDREPFPREKICAGAIGGRAERALAGIGVEVRAPSVPIHGLAVRTGDGELALRLHEHAGVTGPIGRVVRRREFDAALLDEVRARGVAVRDGIGVRGVTLQDNAVLLETTSGVITARAVVGADGVGSTVRRALDFPRGEFYAQAVEVDTPLVATDRAPDLLSFELSDRRYAGYSWAFPTLVDGELMMCRGVYRLVRGVPTPCSRHGAATPASRRGAATPASRRGASNAPREVTSHAANDPSELDVTARLVRELDALGIATGGLAMKRFAERGLALHEPCARPRALLVGEAAGIDPVLGEGIAQAILYGKMAGTYLARSYRESRTPGELARHGYRFDDYRRVLASSRVGVDLRLRAHALAGLYGTRRATFERWVTRSESLAIAGMCYFAGRRVPRLRLVRALYDLFRIAA